MIRLFFFESGIKGLRLLLAKLEPPAVIRLMTLQNGVNSRMGRTVLTSAIRAKALSRSAIAIAHWQTQVTWQNALLRMPFTQVAALEAFTLQPSTKLLLAGANTE